MKKLLDSEIEIMYHCDIYWGLSENHIHDYDYDKLVLRLEKENPDSSLINKIYCPISYWSTEKRLNKELDQHVQRRIIIRKFKLYEKYTGLKSSEILESEYGINLFESYSLWKGNAEIMIEEFKHDTRPTSHKGR